MSFELNDLGWGPFFADQVTAAENPLQPARVAAVHKYGFMLAACEGFSPAVVAGKTLHGTDDQPDLPVVGDWVLAKPPVGGTAVIVRRLERRSELSRRRPLDRQSLKMSLDRQVLAANLDYVFIVISLNLDLNIPRLERALIMVWNSGATPVVLLSKADLCADAAAKAADVQAAANGAQVHFFSSLQGQGLDVIRGVFAPGVTGCLLGSSGAGKTTLLNALCGTDCKTLAIRGDDDKGRHATTARALFLLPSGGMLIDTPGLREIGLMEEEGLSSVFADIAGLAGACKYKDCSHQSEPDCEVLAALADGRLPRDRYEHYLKLRKELAYQESKTSRHGQLETKKKQKQLAKLVKNYYKHS